MTSANANQFSMPDVGTRTRAGQVVEFKPQHVMRALRTEAAALLKFHAFLKQTNDNLKFEGLTLTAMLNAAKAGRQNDAATASPSMQPGAQRKRASSPRGDDDDAAAAGTDPRGVEVENNDSDSEPLDGRNAKRARPSPRVALHRKRSGELQSREDKSRTGLGQPDGTHSYELGSSGSDSESGEDAPKAGARLGMDRPPQAATTAGGERRGLQVEDEYDDEAMLQMLNQAEAIVGGGFLGEDFAG